MPAQPAIRGLMSRMLLDAARNLPAEAQRSMFPLVPEPVIALIESTPRLGWEQSFRDCGKIVYQPRREAVNDGRAEMVLEGFPRALLRSGTFPESLAGTFDMYLRRVSKKGRVDILGIELEQGRVVYGISWQ